MENKREQMKIKRNTYEKWTRNTRKENEERKEEKRKKQRNRVKN